MSLVAQASEKEQESCIEYALEITDLRKYFRRQTLRSGYTTLKSSLLSWSKKSAPTERAVTKAIDGLTVRIPRGASVGIIGRNGSGKSTLLKLISGIYKPDTGSVTLHGRAAALIELGAGFHPDFSGRENVYLGGVMHGMSKAQIDARFDDIVTFAELAHVIDDPVRTYSSGMFMRLGFSLAVHTDPDILIVDEVLAVGDAAFVSKCKERIAELRKKGKTLLLVTHDLEAVERWCDEAVWLHEGGVRDRGDPRRVIDHYRQFVARGEEVELKEQAEEVQLQTSTVDAPHEAATGRWGSREIEISAVRLLDRDGNPRLLFHCEDQVNVEIDYTSHEPVTDYVFGVGIHRSDGLLVHGTNSDIERLQLPALRAKGTLCYRIERVGLVAGNYLLDVAVHKSDGYPYDYQKGALTFAVRGGGEQAGVFNPPHVWTFDGQALGGDRVKSNV